MDLTLSLKQSQQLSPMMVQSMEILQLSSLELLSYIETITQENPVLEPVTPDQPAEVHNQDLHRKLRWLESTDVQNRYYHRQDSENDADPMANLSNCQESDENLYYYLTSQLQPLELPAAVAATARYIVEGLDQNGWMDEDLADIAHSLSVPLSVVNRALEVVQSLDPAGVAARNLAECLTLQLNRRPSAHPLALAIVADCLDALGKKQYNLIGKRLSATPEQVREACALIRSLNPRPGSGFAARENLSYINPDVFVVSFPDHFEVLTNDYFFPTLSLSGYYCNLLKQSNEPAVQEYLQDKVRQAKWVIRSIDQRRSTLLACTHCILEIQESFFRTGKGHLVPMVLADVAARLELHESTISRAIKNKYLQCASGVYPLGFFFSRGLGADGGGASPHRAKCLMRDLLAAEDPKKPLSDQALCKRLAEHGVELSRRTVAKYREELGIANTSGRRQYE